MSAVPRNVTLAGRLRQVNRLTIGTALAIVALIVVASSFALGLLALIDTTRLQAKVLAESAGASLMFQDAKSAQELMQPLRNLPQVHEAVLYTPAGSVFARYEHSGHGPHTLPGPAAVHVTRVLRLAAGDGIVMATEAGALGFGMVECDAVPTGGDVAGLAAVARGQVSFRLSGGAPAVMARCAAARDTVMIEMHLRP